MWSVLLCVTENSYVIEPLHNYLFLKHLKRVLKIPGLKLKWETCRRSCFDRIIFTSPLFMLAKHRFNFRFGKYLKSLSNHSLFSFSHDSIHSSAEWVVNKIIDVSNTKIFHYNISIQIVFCIEPFPTHYKS